MPKMSAVLAIRFETYFARRFRGGGDGNFSRAIHERGFINDGGASSKGYGEWRTAYV